MDDDTGPTGPSRRLWSWVLPGCLILLMLLGGFGDSWFTNGRTIEAAEPGGPVAGSPLPETDALPESIILSVIVLLACSAFFSGSETAFFSIHRIRLRAMSEEAGFSGRLVASMMDRPSRLLTTILLGNMIVNVLIGVLLGTRIEDLFAHHVGLPPVAAYIIAVALCTGALVMFGEITPKVLAVHSCERFARIASLPLLLTNKMLAPIRDGLVNFTNAVLRVMRFHQLHVAPFITDDELKAALFDGEVQGVIEQDERQMIQGILEFGDAILREILVPRPDMIVLSENAKVREALDVLREHEYSRMPVYGEDVDHITGVLVAKDLMSSFARGELDREIHTLARPPHFVPSTMTAQQFVKDAQRHRTHLAIVVDEYGGTAGLVTLEDAIEQVVGDLLDKNEHNQPGYEALDAGVYRVEGSFPLDELNELMGTTLEDEEHETVAGFVMTQSDKIPEPGDEIVYENVRFIVEACDGKRVLSLRVHAGASQSSEEVGS